MSTRRSFQTDFKVNQKNVDKLNDLFTKSESDEIADSIVKNANEALGLKVWSSVLSLLKDEEKLFDVVSNVLPKLNRDQLTTKVLNDFYSRLCIELPIFSMHFVIKLAFFCENCMQFGDSRAYFFKDVLPCALQVIAKDDRPISFDGISKPASDYQQQIIVSILSKPFKVSILTAITAMFKDIPLNKSQSEMLLGKICDNFSNVNQGDVSGLALACFNLALFNKLIIPMLALDTYFFNKRYKHKFIEFDSANDFDSIDETAEKGVIEMEENVIFHFQQVTEFTMIEKDIVAALKSLSYAPKFIISPFIATVLVSFAKMSSSSVVGNLRLPQSILLPFLKQVFKNNEKHRGILKHSAWARSVDQFDPLDIDKLLKVLQENTCKLGQNVALNGFIGLTFMLLKTKAAPALNSFAVQFLNELVKQRNEFAGDIMRIVVKMLFSETNKGPIIECFSIMIQNRALPIDRCEDALTDLIVNLDELELDTAMAIESVIFSAISKSTKLRDLMSQTMRSSMYQNKPGMRRLAVYSFCVMLKKVTKPTQGNVRETFAASQNISLMSLMSQSQIPSTEKVNMRRVSVLVLEILGILRKCFSHSVEVRVTLYENLLSAVAANPFIIPNVLELVESYFRSYFDCEDAGTVIDFSKVFKDLGDGEVIVMDDLGKFLNFFIGCIEISKQKILDDGNVQIANYSKIIDKLTSRVCEVSLEQLGVFSVFTPKSSATVTQFLNCLEVLTIYCCRDLNNENITRISQLFDKHQKITTEALKIQETCKKASKRGKNQTEVTIAAPKVELKLECVWDLKACGEFLKIIFGDHLNEKVNEIKQNQSLVRFVLKSIGQKILLVSPAAADLHFKHSKSIFKSLKTYAAIVYKQMELETFTKLYEDFDSDSAVAITEAFKNAVTSMDVTYNSTPKWQEFLQNVTRKTITVDGMINEVIKTLQMIIDWLFGREEDDPNAEKVALNLFTAMELLFKNFQNLPNDYTKVAYNWCLSFCKNNELNQKGLHIVNRVLFLSMTQHDARQGLMEHIADKISRTYGKLDEDVDEVEDSPQNDLKTITDVNVDQTLIYFMNTVKKQVEDVEFVILRMNSFNAHVKIPGQDSRNESINAIQSMEKSCVIKLTYLGKVIGRLCNARFNVRGNQIESVGKIVTGYFVCLCNLMKHFLHHFNVSDIDFRMIPLEILMKETKIAVKQIYGLAPYIEDMMQEDRKEAEKKNKKVIPCKEFKYNSRLVRAVENFSELVEKFDQQTKKNFRKHIHNGDVRDFRMQKPSKRRSTRAASDVTEESVTEVSEVEAESDSDEEIAPRAKKSRINQIESSSDEEDLVDDDATESDISDASHESPLPVLPRGFEKNLEVMNKKAEKAKKMKK